MVVGTISKHPPIASQTTTGPCATSARLPWLVYSRRLPYLGSDLVGFSLAKQSCMLLLPGTFVDWNHEPSPCKPMYWKMHGWDIDREAALPKLPLACVMWPNNLPSFTRSLE